MTLDHLWRYLADNAWLLVTGLGLGWYTSTVLIHVFNLFDGTETLFRRFRRHRPTAPVRRPGRHRTW